jgi:hypothetical protein
MEEDPKSKYILIKALNIVEFLLKNGPEFAVNQLKRDLDFFRTM